MKTKLFDFSPEDLDYFRALIEANVTIEFCVPESSLISPCWLWKKGSKKSETYGQVVFKGTTYRIHRVSWLVYRGPIPEEKPCVLHECDIPLCVSPYHLFVGTDSDNVYDMVGKGRNRTGAEKNRGRPSPLKGRFVGPASPMYGKRGPLHPTFGRLGESCARHKLTEESVKKVFRLRAEGKLQREIAKEVGSSQSNVSSILSGEIWPHVYSEVSLGA